jgi:hypothetical protein
MVAAFPVRCSAGSGEQYEAGEMAGDLHERSHLRIPDGEFAPELPKVPPVATWTPGLEGYPGLPRVRVSERISPSMVTVMLSQSRTRFQRN